MARVRMAFRMLLAGLLLCAALALLIPVFLRLATGPFMYSNASEVPNAEAVVVLGASVVRGRPSPALAKRADAAIELYTAGKATKILVTGDNGTLTYDEVTPVRKYLTDAGIPDEDIFLDHAGFDTYSSMYRALHVFQARSITVVTQDFHLPRALFIARRLGLEAYGLAAAGEGGFNRDYLREIPASSKALWDLWMGRMPRYFDEEIPLSGSGTSTWW